MLFLLYLLKQSQSAGRTYANNSLLVAYFNNIGLKNSPAEDLPLKSLSFFRGLKIDSKANPRMSMSDLLLGNRLEDVGIHVSFQHNEDKKQAFQQTVSENDMKTFKKYINRGYNYQIYFDGLKKYVPIGENAKEGLRIYSRFEFNIFTNKNSVIDVMVNATNPKDITKVNSTIKIYYLARFDTTTIPFEHRAERYYDREFFENSLHDKSCYLNILQSFLFLLLIATIFHQMISDFNKQSSLRDFDEFDLQVSNDRGWKIMHGDVFRTPKHSSILAILSGIGTHIALAFFTFSIVVYFSNERNSVLATAIISYVLTSFVSGLASTAYSNSFSEHKWLRICFGSVFFPILSVLFLFFVVKLLTNGKSAYSLPILYLLLSFVVQAFPVTLFATFGGWLSKKNEILASNPSEIALVPRTIPKQPWYMKPLPICIAGGLLIASSILPEFFYVQTSIWQGRIYYTYSHLLCVIFTSIISAACMSISITFFRLQCECYSWHWLSFLAPSSCGCVLFIYSICFFLKKLGGTCFSGVIVYFSWSIGICIAISAACGSIGFLSANLFIRTVFSNLKLD